MRIFVTGASGFVGGHFAEAMSSAHEVWAMARSDASAKKVEAYGARAIRADLDTVSAKDLEGCDAVVHAAAFVEEWGTREMFWRANVLGTQAMLDAARAAGVRRFLHVGTEAALFDGHDLVGIDETTPYPAAQKYLYSETKAEAERRVLAANAATFTTMSIRPRFVWGPRDTSVLPAVLRMAKAGSWTWLDGGKHMTSTTHVKNLVRALELALTKGSGGEAYFVADDGERTIKSFLSALAATQGVALPERSMPGGVARFLARAVEGTWRLFRIRKTPPMTRFAIDMMSSSVTVNDSLARKELGYSPIIDVESGLRDLKAS